MTLRGERIPAARFSAGLPILPCHHTPCLRPSLFLTTLDPSAFGVSGLFAVHQRKYGNA